MEVRESLDAVETDAMTLLVPVDSLVAVRHQVEKEAPEPRIRIVPQEVLRTQGGRHTNPS